MHTAPSVHGKQIKPGMRIQIAPTTVKQEEYGFMVGTVTYVAGYGNPSDVPQEIRQAVLMKAGLLYGSSRGCSPDMAMEKAIDCLLDMRSFRVFY